MTVRSQLYPGPSVAALAIALTASGAHAADAIYVPNKLPLPAATSTDTSPLTLTTDPAALVSAELHLQSNNPLPRSGLDVNTFLGANRFYNAGITGQGATVANIEAGRIWNGHETLTNVTTSLVGLGALGDYDRHATWVGMMIAGRNGGTTQGSFQTGIAMGATLRSGSVATAWTGSAYSTSFSLSSDSNFGVYQPQFGSADVINSSWGFTDATGANFFTIGFDGLAFAHPHTTLVVSAGNSGPGSNSIIAPGAGYNAITVAALGPANSYNAVSSFSSRGPQDYSDPAHGTLPATRARVDIAAPGQSLTSAYYGGATGGNATGVADGAPDAYSDSLAGTSFAAPIVAGAATLLDSAAYNTPSLASNSDARDARVIKAVLMNSADKTAAWSNGQTVVAGVVQTTQSLDYAVGAGRLNLNRAYDQYLSGTTDVPGSSGGSVDNIGWDFGSVSPLAQNSYAILDPLKAGTTFTATLSWFRDRSFLNNSAVTDNAFRDLDLQVWDASFTTLIAQSISNYNDSEHLSFTLPSDGLYALRVVYDQTIFGTAAPESYALAWSAVPTPEPSIVGALGILPLIFHRRRHPNRGATTLIR